MTDIRCVLSIDDSEADQYLNRVLIEQVDPSIEVHCAYDGEEALELLREGKFVPDLVLLDINMPRMDGFAFLDAYEVEFGTTPRSVIVMLTSSNQGTDRERAEQYSTVAGYLVKPLGDDWRDQVEQLMRGE